MHGKWLILLVTLFSAQAHAWWTCFSPAHGVQAWTVGAGCPVPWVQVQRCPHPDTGEAWFCFLDGEPL